MSETVLIPVDGSAEAEAITQWARPWYAGRAVEVVQAVVPLLESWRERPQGEEGERHLRLRKEHAERYVEELVERLRGEGVEATGRVVLGDPAGVIVDRAEALPGSVVAMTTHGRSGVTRWVRGSVAERVLRRCSAPVLVVNAARAEESSEGVQRVWVPLDGSEAAGEIVPSVVELARRFGAGVSLLRVGVVEQEGPTAEWVRLPDEGALRASLEPARMALEEAGVEVEAVTALGSPAGEIVERAESTPGSLVALSTHGRSGVGRWVFGSVTEAVLRRCKAPLWVRRVRGAL